MATSGTDTLDTASLQALLGPGKKGTFRLSTSARGFSLKSSRTMNSTQGGPRVGSFRFEQAPRRQTKPNVLSHFKFRAFGVIPQSDARRFSLFGFEDRGRFQTKPISLTHVKFRTFGVIPRSDARRITLFGCDGRGRFQTKPMAISRVKFKGFRRAPRPDSLCDIGLPPRLVRRSFREAILQGDLAVLLQEQGNGRGTWRVFCRSGGWVRMRRCLCRPIPNAVRASRGMAMPAAFSKKRSVCLVP